MLYCNLAIKIYAGRQKQCRTSYSCGTARTNESSHGDFYIIKNICNASARVSVGRPVTWDRLIPQFVKRPEIMNISEVPYWPYSDDIQHAYPEYRTR